MRGDLNYPFWPPLARPANNIVALQVRNIIADLAVNQVPRGNDTQIGLIQRPYPRQAQALQPDATQNQVSGHTGPTLYDLFMAPYRKPQAGG